MKAARLDRGRHPRLTLADLAKSLRHSTETLRCILTSFDLPAQRERTYGIAHLRFLKRIIALKILGVSEGQLLRIYEFEKKLITILDGENPESPTWPIDSWARRGAPRRRLFLTQFDAGCDLHMYQVQAQLPFSTHPQELFSSVDMGENLESLLHRYVKMRDEVVKKALTEEQRIRHAIRGIGAGLKPLT